MLVMMMAIEMIAPCLIIFCGGMTLSSSKEMILPMSNRVQYADMKVVAWVV